MGSIPSQSRDVHTKVRAELEKKNSFLAAVKSIESSVAACDLGERGRQQLGALMPLVHRAFTVLRARHTNIQFWRAGLSLAMICLVGRSCPMQPCVMQTLNYHVVIHSFIAFRPILLGDICTLGYAS